MSEENTATDMNDPDDTIDTDTEEATSVDPAANSEAAAASPVATDEGFDDQVRAVETPTMVSEPRSVGGGGATADIAMILDIPVTLSMEIGQTRISINELLKLSKDSVIELQRMADEPMDVLVNGTLVAHGEAVVVGDRFGIRLTDVISPQERLRKFA